MRMGVRRQLAGVCRRGHLVQGRCKSMVSILSEGYSVAFPALVAAAAGTPTSVNSEGLLGGVRPLAGQGFLRT